MREGDKIRMKRTGKMMVDSEYRWCLTDLSRTGSVNVVDDRGDYAILPLTTDESPVKVGDKIEITATEETKAGYKTGDIGKIVACTGRWGRVFVVNFKHAFALVYAHEFKVIKPVKRGIRIQARETKTGDIEIIGLTGLSREKLPDEYLNGFPRVVYDDTQLHIRVSRYCIRQVTVGQVYPKQVFDEILTVCRAAGSRLREINERRQEPFEVVI
jgi:hypothetical protein